MLPERVTFFGIVEKSFSSEKQVIVAIDGP